jgi:hypothetical protein
MRTIHLTKLQSDELHHKLVILRDDEDLRESCEISEEAVENLIAALPNGEGLFTFDEEHGMVMAGEVENLIDIARSNMRGASDKEMASLRGYMNSMRRLSKRLQEN